jgi:hypothetical protein
MRFKVYFRGQGFGESPLKLHRLTTLLSMLSLCSFRISDATIYIPVNQIPHFLLDFLHGLEPFRSMSEPNTTPVPIRYYLCPAAHLSAGESQLESVQHLMNQCVNVVLLSLSLIVLVRRQIDVDPIIVRIISPFVLKILVIEYANSAFQMSSDLAEVEDLVECWHPFLH